MISIPDSDLGREVMVAADEQSFDELIRALTSRNEAKIQSLIESGKAFAVRNDVRVEILGGSGNKIKVRLLEGARADAEAWVLDRWVRNP